MDKISNFPGLDFNQDLKQEEMMWKVQRISWIVMGVIVFLTLIGLFANGFLSSANVKNGGLQLSYPRFGRYGYSQSMNVIMSGLPTNKGKFSFMISRNFLNPYTVQEVTPSPSSVIYSHNELTYIFDKAAGVTEINVSITLLPNSAGLNRGTINSGGDRVDFYQFIYQ